AREAAIARFSAPERVRVVLTSRTLVSYVGVWRATARALAELGAPAFFIAGVVWTPVGDTAPWFVLASVLLSVALRSIDIEARALFIPGGLYGSVRECFGRFPAKLASSAQMVERLMLGALAAVVAAQYLIALSRSLVGLTPLVFAGESGPALAVILIGIVWVLQRQGRATHERRLSDALGVAVAVLAVLTIWAAATLWFRSGTSAPPLPFQSPPAGVPPRGVLGLVPQTYATIFTFVLLVAAGGYSLPTLGGVDALGTAAVDLEQPRIRNLQRVARLVTAYGLAITAALAFLVVALIPSEELRA